jgi:hypothetical protein
MLDDLTDIIIRATGVVIARLELADEGQVLARLNGPRRRLKISMPRWRLVSTWSILG